MNTATITVDSDVCPFAAATIIGGLRGMAAKEAAYERYMAAVAVYQAAEDAANVLDAPEDVLATWRAADEACEAARAEWLAL